MPGVGESEMLSTTGVRIVCVRVRCVCVCAAQPVCAQRRESTTKEKARDAALPKEKKRKNSHAVKSQMCDLDSAGSAASFFTCSREMFMNSGGRGGAAAPVACGTITINQNSFAHSSFHASGLAAGGLSRPPRPSGRCWRRRTHRRRRRSCPHLAHRRRRSRSCPAFRRACRPHPRQRPGTSSS